MRINNVTRRLFGAVLLVSSSAYSLHAQLGTPPTQPIRQYIDSAWDNLSRSMQECASLKDVKVTTAPVLYLPADVPTPAAVAALHAGCGVEIAHLPRPIKRLGQVMPQELSRPGLLYLPNRYVVPGGRFNEMYGWDSYFIVLGLTEDGRTELARGMVENFFYEIKHYGALLNANRTYFLTRSQPPLLAEMIREVHTQDQATGKDTSHDWIRSAYAAAQADYALWTSAEHRAGTTGLARFFDIGEGPVLEMADDSSYYPDAIRWMLVHRVEGASYLVAAAKGDRASCDQVLTAVCRHAEVDGMRLTRDFYRGDRAMRESGFDTSFRFGAFSGSTHQFAPVCLNSLLYRYELDMAAFSKELGRSQEETLWRHRARARLVAMNHYLWSAAQGQFVDYNFVTRRQSTYLYSTIFYPLWAGVATKPQAASIVKHLSQLELDHGLAMSGDQTGMQWDRPFGWAPEVWFAVEGLRAASFPKDADRLAGKFRSVVETNYTKDGTIREKYNVATGSADVRLAAGYKANGLGFGWTNGVYLRFLPKPAGPSKEQARGQ
jgi:alpha,alpha-trehalase